MRVQRLRRRARLLDGDDVMSEILDHPGPTDALFDVLAACVAALTPGPRIAVLGFAAGGLVPPLRAMGCAAPLRGVDLSRTGVALFRELAGDWAGDVRVTHADAEAWLRRQRAPFDVLVEDLSLPSTRTREGVKPNASLYGLPDLMHARLQRRGLAVTNFLPHPDLPWTRLLAFAARPFRHAAYVYLDDYVNRLLLASDAPLPPRTVSRRVRAALRAIGSMQSDRIAVRSLPD